MVAAQRYPFAHEKARIAMATFLCKEVQHMPTEGNEKNHSANVDGAGHDDF